MDVKQWIVSNEITTSLPISATVMGAAVVNGSGSAPDVYHGFSQLNSGSVYVGNRSYNGNGNLSGVSYRLIVICKA